MNPMKLLLAAAAVALALPASTSHAQDGLIITEPYARVSAMTSKSGAAFMVIENPSDSDDRLIAAASDIAEKVELHTHIQDANGVMKMREVPEGFVIPAHGSHALARGGDHVMFLGLTRTLAQGDTIRVTLTFETAGEMVLDIPVDLSRAGAMPQGGMQGMQQGQGQGMNNGMGQMNGAVEGASN